MASSMSLDIHALGAAQVTHAQAELDSAIYFITPDFTTAVDHKKLPVSICILFSAVGHQEALGQSPNSPTNDYTYIYGITARGDSDEKQDELIDDAVQAILGIVNAPGHGFPIFDYTASEVERSIAISSTPKQAIEGIGITTSVTVAIRIMEDD